MNMRNFAVTYKTLIGIAVLFAVSFQFVSSLSRPTFDPVNFFSFFTIESNIFGALVILTSAYFWYRNKTSITLDYARGAAALYMTITGIVYTLLLSGLEASLQTPIPWVNFILHTFFPIALLVDWFIDRPSAAINLKPALIWLVFPLAYVVYSLLRGQIVGWYPYPFLNPANDGGYASVAIVSAGIAVTALIITWALTTSVRARH